MRLVLPFLVVAAPALAAQGPDTTGTDSAAVTLAPITVTATRTFRTLFEVPLAVSRVDKRRLFGTSGYGLNDALQLVPGVVAQSRYGSSDVRITIRGFGARGAGDRSNAGTSRGIRVLLDGFPETEPDGRTSFDGIDLAAAQGVEVVRSNASATWGNAAGGVIDVSTLPEFNRGFVGLEGMGGGSGLRRIVARAGVLVEPGRLSASFVRTDFDGWREHSASRRSLLNLALVTPFARRTRLGVFLVGSANLFRIPGPLTRAQADSAPWQANAVYAQRDERRDNLVGRIGVALDHAFRERQSVSAMVFVSPKRLRRSERGTFRDFTRYHLGGNVVYRLVTRLGPRASGALVAGVDQAYQDGAILFYSLTPAGTRGDTLRADRREGAGNVGVFVQEEVTAGRIGLTLGARFDDITYSYQDYLDPSLDARKSFRGVTPKLGFNYRLTPVHSLYASVGGGVEAPAGNETDPASTFGQDTVTAINPLLEPIRSTTYEVGTKHTVGLGAGGAGLLRLVAYDVALYQTDVRNEIVPYRGGRFYFTAGRVRRRGAELGLRLEAAGGVSCATALAWADHRYTRYVVDSVHYGRPGVFADYSGNRVVGVPDVTYAASLTLAPAALRPFRVQVGVQGTSSYFADDANQVSVPAFRTVSLTVGVEDAHPLGAAAVRGFVTVSNLFDRHYLASAFLNPDVVGGQAVAFEPGLPRQLLVAISLTNRGAPL
jgi:iron complex outermembrane recepter protein